MATTLIPTWTLGGLDLTSHPFAIEFGGDHGAPESLSELVTSLLADGDLVRPTRHGNREISIVVLVEGASLGELAENEAVLRGECTKPKNTLSFNPGDFDSPVSVFEVLMVQMRQPRDETQESHLLRRWELTLTCAPFARSADPVTVEALPAGTSTVSVDTCDSTAGWTSARSGVPDSVSNWGIPGAVGVAELDTVETSPETWTLTRTGSIDFTVTPYLVAEIRTISFQRGLRVTASVGGIKLPVIDARLMTDGDFFHRVTFDASGVGVASSITFSHVSIVGEPWQGLFVRQVSRSDVSPGVTSRQLSRIIKVGGTERTPGSIHVTPGIITGVLGDVLVHTCPEDGSGYSPPLRRWRVSGQTVASNLSAFSLAQESVTGTGITCDVPTSALPEGGYLLVAYMRTDTPGTVGVAWSSSTIFPGGTVEEGFTNGVEYVNFPNTGWQFVCLGLLSLPSVRTKAGKVRIIIQVPTGPTVLLDEAWLFREDDDCALSIIRTPQPHLWLDSPDLESPVPTVWIGDGQETRVHPGTGLIAQGSHILSPAGTAVFTAALRDNPATEATFYRRWHSNAAE